MSAVVEILMPHLQPGVHNGELLCWFKRTGQLVRPGESIAEIREAGRTTTIRSFDHGIILELLAEEGTGVRVGDVVAKVQFNGESELLVETSDGMNRERQHAVVDFDWDTSPDLEEPVPGIADSERYPESFEW
jgi:pyruvate/2-oxoglutarate dehydrogenase complex dihydrolipoamide acyltransferase (E2) component